MKTIKNNFNLVEIILAMGIIIVCITTIMGMFSFGMKVSNEAVMQNYMSNILEQLGGMVETHPDGEKVPTLTAAPYDETTAAATVKAEEDACTTAIDADDPFFKNVYYDGATMDTIKIEYKTSIGGNEAIDFTAFARMYIQADSTTFATTSGNITTDNDVLHIQVTWPSNKPYGDRVLEGNVQTFEKPLRP